MARSMQARICLGWFCTAVAQQPSACRDAPEFGLPATWRTTMLVRGCGCRHLSFCVRREKRESVTKSKYYARARSGRGAYVEEERESCCRLAMRRLRPASRAWLRSYWLKCRGPPPSRGPPSRQRALP